MTLRTVLQYLQAALTEDTKDNEVWLSVWGKELVTVELKEVLFKQALGKVILRGKQRSTVQEDNGHDGN